MGFMLEWIVALGFSQLIFAICAFRYAWYSLKLHRAQAESNELSRKMIEAHAERLKNTSFQIIQICAAFGEHEKRIAKLEQSRTYDAAGGVN